MRPSGRVNLPVANQLITPTITMKTQINCHMRTYHGTVYQTISISRDRAAYLLRAARSRGPSRAPVRMPNGYEMTDCGVNLSFVS